MILARQSKRNIVSLHATKPHGEMEVQLHSLLKHGLDGDKWSSSCPGRFTFGERAPVPFELEAGRAQSRTGRSGEGVNLFLLPHIEIRFLGRTAHSLVTTLTTLYCNTI